jgi:hypothetical protein
MRLVITVAFAAALLSAVILRLLQSFRRLDPVA